MSARRRDTLLQYIVRYKFIFRLFGTMRSAYAVVDYQIYFWQ